MPVIVNFKTCDNTPDCNGIPICPTQAITFNEKTSNLEIDEDKCILCGECERSCGVNSIFVLQTQEEYEKKKKEIDEDPRTTSDLFVERYGATHIAQQSTLRLNNFELSILKATIPMVLEINVPENIECLIKSVSFKEIMDAYAPKCSLRKKVTEDLEDLKFLGVTKTPALLFYYKGKCLHKIEGYFSNEEKEPYLEEISKILKK